MIGPASPPDTAVAPAYRRCPSCRSVDVVTTNRDKNETAYWRCNSCGDIWNPSRIGIREGGRDRAPLQRPWNS